MVYVISKEGKPLMPTEHHVKVRRALKDSRAAEDFRIVGLVKEVKFDRTIIKVNIIGI